MLAADLQIHKIGINKVKKKETSPLLDALQTLLYPCKNCPTSQPNFACDHVALSPLFHLFLV